MAGQDPNSIPNDEPKIARLDPRADTMYRIHEVSRLISIYFDRLVAVQGITRAQWTAIMHVSQNPGSTQTDLANIMQLGRAAAGKMFDRLEEKGWIERRADENDNRLRRVYSAEAAEALLGFIPEAANQLYEEFYKGMSEEQIETLYAALIQMRDNGNRALGKDGGGAQERED